VNRNKKEVIMSRLLKPFAELSLKVIAVDTIDNSDVPLQFPASSPPASSHRLY